VEALLKLRGALLTFIVVGQKGIARMQQKRLIQFAFPAFPAERFTSYEQALLGGLEAHLTRGCKRVYVRTDVGMGNFHLACACIERLLAHTSTRRILLVLASAVYESLARRELERIVTREGEEQFCSRFPVQFFPPLPLDDETTRLCVVSLRKLTFRLRRLQGQLSPHAQQSQELVGEDELLTAVRDQFDVVVLYGMDAVTESWQYLLQTLDVPCSINFSHALDPLALNVFDLNVVCSRTAASDTLRAVAAAHALAHPGELEKRVATLIEFFRPADLP
jgi:hypothetical protein